MTKVHEVPYLPTGLAAIRKGLSILELAFNGRNFKTGDFLFLREYSYGYNKFGPEWVLVKIKNINTNKESDKNKCINIEIQLIDAGYDI